MGPRMNRSVILTLFGSLLIVLGIALEHVFWPNVIQRIKRQKLALSPSSESFKVWKDSNGFPRYLDIYIFNWTNPEEIRTPGVKPNFVEVGPYRFTEERRKTNITFNPSNSTVSFFQNRHWYFDDKNSNGSLQDLITQLNVVAVASYRKVRHWPYFKRRLLPPTLSSFREIHVTNTVDELMFAGYNDPIIDIDQSTVNNDPRYLDKFGWFHGRNGSANFEGHYNVATGQDDIKNLGLIRNWNYRVATKLFASPCNDVEESAGELWTPGRTKEDIRMFSAEYCRTLTCEYNRTILHRGIEAHRYDLGDRTLGNQTMRRYPHEQAKFFETTTTTEDFFAVAHFDVHSTTDEDPDVVNEGNCFCDGECIPSGMFNITSCNHGIPTFVSLPHFYKADHFYKDQVTGMNPNEEDHSFHITLEPTTGVPLEFQARTQVNVLLEPLKNIDFFKNVPKIYFPIFWCNQHGAMSGDIIDSLKQFMHLSSIGFYCGMTLMLPGFLIVAGVAILHFVQKRSGISLITIPEGVVSPEQRVELVYLDPTLPNGDTHMRDNRQLYPKLS